jgi:hypothetical protein
MSQVQMTYPLTLKGELTEPLSRGLWLVKWLLGIPHYIIMVFLSVAAIIVSIIAFFAIVFTGRYPRDLFDFVVGVMRWSWRVCFWSYEALGTDKYPPFTLESVADYPADLNVEYPEKLSRGLVWIKWWLLALPQYVIVSVFQGGTGWYKCGLLTIISVFAGVGLLFTGKYHADFFKFVMGMNRWCYRVGAYTLLMTDKYPPFSLD